MFCFLSFVRLFWGLSQTQNLTSHVHQHENLHLRENLGATPDPAHKICRSSGPPLFRKNLIKSSPWSQFHKATWNAVSISIKGRPRTLKTLPPLRQNSLKFGRHFNDESTHQKVSGIDPQKATQSLPFGSSHYGSGEPPEKEIEDWAYEASSISNMYKKVTGNRAQKLAGS